MKSVQKMTLDEIWDECDRMWQDMKRLFQKHPVGPECLASVLTKTKELWLIENGYCIADFWAGCFFCSVTNVCDQCPGRQVDPAFDCADFKGHKAFDQYPIEFADYIHELNLERKGGTS